MEKTQFLGIEIDEVAPFVTFTDNLDILGLSFTEKNGGLYIKLELGGLTNYSVGEGDEYIHFYDAKLKGEALLKILDVKIEELPLNEETGAEVLTLVDLEEERLDDELFSENPKNDTDPWWHRFFKSKKKNLEARYNFGFRRDNDPDRPVIFFFPDNQNKTLLKVRGRKLTLLKYSEAGPDYFFLLNEEFKINHFPKIYDLYEHDPLWAAEQIQSIANKWHEGNITSAAQALESDLQHG